MLGIPSHLEHPVMGHFYGAPAMALMTVGVGAMVAGYRLIGQGPALAPPWTPWPAVSASGPGPLVW